jgi:hypothetical protein
MDTEELAVSETFKVGEVAIYNRPCSVWHSSEVEIVGLLELTLWNDPILNVKGESPCYECRNPVYGLLFVAEPHELKKKRPPRDDFQIVRWADCPWQPEKVRA